MKQADLKKIIAEELKMLLENEGEEEEFEDLYSGHDYDEYNRAIDMGDIGI